MICNFPLTLWNVLVLKFDSIVSSVSTDEGYWPENIFTTEYLENKVTQTSKKLFADS